MLCIAGASARSARYDKALLSEVEGLATNFLGNIHLAAAIMWWL